MAKDYLVEWYENIGVDSGAVPPPPPPAQGDSAPEPKETPQEISKELDKFGELYKMLALARLLESKLVFLSDVYQNVGDDAKNKSKQIVKEIIKKLNELSSKI